MLEKIVSSREYRHLTEENALNILEDKVFTPLTPIEYVKKKSLFGFLGFGKK